MTKHTFSGANECSAFRADGLAGGSGTPDSFYASQFNWSLRRGGPATCSRSLLGA